MNALGRREAKGFLPRSDYVGIGQRSQPEQRPRERGRDFGDPRLGAHAAWIEVGNGSHGEQSFITKSLDESLLARARIPHHKIAKG
ncbi:hypothetical protein [Ralstonia pseudosolanacearum]|uniref:hypothetical protein n=1 Tax=Ralstonia pseudosolanacearum TaxID=1310165 RepID=UPI0013C4ED5B|nr:hypothetical protein [Ralstonia pseudosolanacearum]MDO3525045.1 hypothetical protein [Ralstonia pseudosolanacearum]MDO3549616.1 hypothetical protein [Ralstonia pseudosolanacearum]MDO3554781.1 hypothetical protein [Ralstonia pseudosolanacearum]MDO3564579.1 hypothetical protein [Ralstonia pseudosolanacearum]MDO3569375.1 hypothetical protein [Ralstonia pseudosolanacearum]